MNRYLIFLLLSFSVHTFSLTQIAKHYKLTEAKVQDHSYGSIDCVYLINLDHRIEKYQESLRELLPYKITPFRFSAVNGWQIRHSVLQEIGMQFDTSMRKGGMASRFVWEDGKEYRTHELVGKKGRTYFAHCMPRGAIGCLMSHISILKDAYESGYEIVWIMEDDIVVLRDPLLLLGYIEELDELVGRDKWDLLYTDRDYRANSGEYVICFGTDYRPDVETRDQKRFDINRKVSTNLRKMGSRFGTTSMIWSRTGIKKYLRYIEKHGIFLPIDMDVHLAPGIQIYSVTKDVVSNRLHAVSDNGRNQNDEVAEY